MPSSQPENSARWTREEYQALIDRALRDYAAASSAVTEAKDSQSGLRGGGKSDVCGTESAAAADADLDRLIAHPRLHEGKGKLSHRKKMMSCLVAASIKRITQVINTFESCVMNKGKFMIWPTATTRQK